MKSRAGGNEGGRRRFTTLEVLMMRRPARALTAAATAAAASLFVFATAAEADSPDAQAGFGQLYHDGAIVRTVATPTPQAAGGVDAIYTFPSTAADGQLSITSTAPGDTDYHGGRWAVYVVEWTVTPYLITSDTDLLAAVSTGDVTITRMPAADFVCPVTPAEG